MISVIKSVIRNLAYHTGLLGAVHHLRNKNTLTVFMFHRVLSTDSEEYTHAEHEFTFTLEGFCKSLDFIRRHYNIVDLDRLKAHVEGEGMLPDRAGLITFDDGWRDTVTQALPELEKRGLPSVLFISTDVLDSHNDRWWQDALVEIVLSPGGLDELEARLDLQKVGGCETRARLYQVTACVGSMTAESREALLTTWGVYVPVDRQMVTREEIRRLGRMRIAGHGHSHIPLTAIDDPFEDLRRSREILAEIGADTKVMSFPHGAVDDEIRVLAKQMGFSLCFDSRPVLMDTRIKWTSNVGRIHVSENALTVSTKGIDEARLASYLFFRSLAS